MEDNMKLFNAWPATPPKAQKTIPGKSYSALNADWRRKVVTQMFGPCGLGWGISDEQYELHSFADVSLNYIAYTAKLWYKVPEDKERFGKWAGQRGEIPIAAEVQMKYEKKRKDGEKQYMRDDGLYKKAATAALMKGFSALGVSSDVYLGNMADWSPESEKGRQQPRSGSANGQTPPANGKKILTREIVKKHSKEIIARLKAGWTHDQLIQAYKGEYTVSDELEGVLRTYQVSVAK